MFYFAVACGEPGANFGGIVIERTHSAAIRNLAALVDDVEALGPCRVGVVRGVVHVVHAEGHGIFEAFGEIVGDGEPVGKITRLGVADIILDV